MDFIERILGIAPDGGNGSLELLYLVALVAGVVVLAGPLRRAMLRRRRSS